MPSVRIPLLSLLVACLLLTAGCTVPGNGEKPAIPDMPASDLPVTASYRIALAQPDADSAMIRMDSDVYNAGEVVEFVVTNNRLIPLECSNTPPDFRVTYQTGSGRWATKMGPESPVEGNKSFLQKGESTKTYRFVSTGWEAGRYRIVSDCGVEHEILIRVPATLTPAATPCPANVTGNTTPAITIDSIPDQVVARPFSITGTTTLPAGTELRYSILYVNTSEQAGSLSPAGSFSTVVQEGTCGSNTWIAMGEIQAPGEFFIGIEDKGGKATAIKRFRVREG